jgi:GGDEF domain-containing protein
LQKKHPKHILFAMNGATDQIIREFEQPLLNLDQEAAGKILREPDGVLLPNARMEASIVPALEHIGREWEEGRLALFQVYLSGRLCEQIMHELRSDWNREPDPGGAKIDIAILEDTTSTGTKLKTTLNLGVASSYEDCDSIEMLLDWGNRALYAAKHAGRNRTDVWLPGQQLPQLA